LATAENLATGLILPELARLRAEYPELTLEIVTDIATVNLHRRDADIALRMVKPERGNVTLQRLGTLGYGLYGAPGYVVARSEAMDASAFDADDFIGWSDTYASLLLNGSKGCLKAVRPRSRQPRLPPRSLLARPDLDWPFCRISWLDLTT
jgi:DNA-binding transcriptional LysR family regulator